MRTSSSTMPSARHYDVLVAGAGHNGLVCAAILARQGLSVLVCDAADAVGGACRTERPFPRAPALGCSTGAYLLGPMPPEILNATGLAHTVRLLPRRPHGYFLLPDSAPRPGSHHPALGHAPRPVAFGVPGGSTHLSLRDRAALDALDTVLAAIRDDLAPLWLREAIPLAQTVECVRDTPAPPGVGLSIRDLYRLLALGASGNAYPSGPLCDFLDRFAFESEFVKAVVATDGFVGSSRGYADPGSGMNFLLHNMLRLPAGDGPQTAHPLGSWQLVQGGMGAITSGLRDCVLEARGAIVTNARVSRIDPAPDGDARVQIDGLGEIRAASVVLATDPWSAADMLAPDAGLHMRRAVESLGTHLGTSLKVNLALRRLPTVVGTSELDGVAPGAHPLAGTVHILPAHDTLARLERARQRAAIEGRAPDPFDAMIDVYTHTAVDPSLCDPEGRHAMSLFVQWVPSGFSPTAAEDFARALIAGPVARIMPDLPELIDDLLVLAPQGIQQRFGIRGGHIHHVDNGWAFDRRLPLHTPCSGVYFAGAGTHPGGSVIGAAGAIVAERVLKDVRPGASASAKRA